MHRASLKPDTTFTVLVDYEVKRQRSIAQIDCTCDSKLIERLSCIAKLRLVSRMTH